MLIQGERQGKMIRFGTLVGGRWEKDFRLEGNVQHLGKLGNCFGIDADLLRTLRHESTAVGGPLKSFLWRVKGGPHYRITVDVVDGLIEAGLAIPFHHGVGRVEVDPERDHGAQYMVPIKYWGIDGRPSKEDPMKDIEDQRLLQVEKRNQEQFREKLRALEEAEKKAQGSLFGDE
jgi:hypothetical protein